MYLIGYIGKYKSIMTFDCLLQIHQDQGRSYKEVCAPVIERCRFLFSELRPAIGNEVNAMSRSKLLKSLPRWRQVTLKMMEDRRRSKRKSCHVFKLDIIPYCIHRRASLKLVCWSSQLLCCLRSIAAHSDHFVRHLSVCLSVCLSVHLSVCLSGSHTFLVVTHRYVLQATHAFLGILPLCYFHSLQG